MTYALEVAREHVSHLGSSGWAWSRIAAQAELCCREMGIGTVYFLDRRKAPFLAVVDAFALAHEAVTRKAGSS